MRCRSLIVLIMILLTACQGVSFGSPTAATTTNTRTPTASRTDTPTISPTVTFTSAPLATSTKTEEEELLSIKRPTITQVPSATFTKTPKPLPTRLPSRTPTPFLSPTPVPTLPPPSPITDREPTVEQLDTYLRALPESFIDVSYCERDTAIEFFLGGGLTEDAQIMYKDVNGDDELDLILSDYLSAAVFIWAGDQYAIPYVVVSYDWYYTPGSHVSFKDWTDDGIPEVEYVTKSHAGGTGELDYIWYKSIIHCEDLICKKIWTGLMTYYLDQGNFGGMYLYDIELINQYNKEGTLQLVKKTDEFSIYDLSFVSFSLSSQPVDISMLSGLVVFTPTLSIFNWSGSTFELVEEKDMGSAYYIEGDSVLSAVSESGVVASIQYENYPEWNMVYNCQLVIDGKKIGEQFTCKYNFTTVEWKNLIGDSQDEIVITALSGWCGARHLIVYRWDGKKYVQVADVAGSVVHSDLFGLYLRDFDQDGQVEIIAANMDDWINCQGPGNCWFAFDYVYDIYKWNGVEFVYWKKMDRSEFNWFSW